MRFAHTSYRITDRGRSLTFYRSLGFELLQEMPVGHATHLFLGLDGSAVLELVVDPAAPAGEAGGYRHLALETGRLAQVLDRVPAERGPLTTPSGARLAFLRDPDGYEIELIESGAPSLDDLTLATAFLHREAELLDDNRVDDWFALLEEDLEYLVPLRYSRERAGGPGFSATAFHMKDSHTSMAGRVKRLSSEYAWAEDPPSRTRRFVANIRVRREDDLLHVRSNLMLYRSRGDSTDHQLLVGERHDVLRVRPGDEVGLARRTVLLDQTTLATHNLAVFL
ncbi:3-phenylpropionate/cinnamic acid dioxygenase subunit beta [Streptosporangium algeriense]|uniref:3-phenylpropionate/cinnamic acid dioxygenase subunit beta n=1 Tax=Streptosporangium algeriense TaxID=1682748 RepID=A0ABW3DIA4_9ACTN